MADDKITVSKSELVWIAGYIEGLHVAGDQADYQLLLQALEKLDTRINLRQRGHTADYLSIIPLTDPISNRKFSIYKSQQWDMIISVYSSWYVHVDGVREILSNQKDCLVGWMATEYDIRPHGAFEPWDFFITNFDELYFTRRKSKALPYQSYLMLNLNALIAKPCPAESGIRPRKVIYYGRYREDRGAYLGRYLDSRIDISTSKKNVSKFKKHGCHGQWYKPIDWTPGRETLRMYTCSLYLEDETTHTIYNHLANRFYEALSCGVVPIFDVTCTNTIQRSGYDIPSAWIVSGPEELHQRVSEIETEWGLHFDMVRHLADVAVAERAGVLDKLEIELCRIRERLSPVRLRPGIAMPAAEGDLAATDQ